MHIPNNPVAPLQTGKGPGLRVARRGVTSRAHSVPGRGGLCDQLTTYTRPAPR